MFNFSFSVQQCAHMYPSAAKVHIYVCITHNLFLNRKCAHIVQTWCCKLWRTGTHKEMSLIKADFQEYWMLLRIQRSLIVRTPTYIVMHASYQDSTTCMCGVFCWSQLYLILGDIKHRSLPRLLMPTSSPLSWTWPVLQQRGSSLSLTSGSLTRLRTTR